MPAIRMGGRGQWRVEGSVLVRWLEQQYEQTRIFIAENPIEDALELTRTRHSRVGFALAHPMDPPGLSQPAWSPDPRPLKAPVRYRSPNGSRHRH
jgi:hypothetical protein